MQKKDCLLENKGQLAEMMSCEVALPHMPETVPGVQAPIE